MPDRLPADLVAAVEQAAARQPNRIAWRFDPGITLTFADIAQRSAGYAQALRERGIGPGDRVAVMLRNQPEFPLLWLALARLGAAMVPVNVRYRSVDAAHVLRDSAAVAVLTTPEFHPLLTGPLPSDDPSVATSPTLSGDHAIVLAPDPGPDRAASERPPVWLLHELEVRPGFAQQTVDPSAVVNVQYTSGTTGAPKGCLLSHRYWITLAASLVHEFPNLAEPDVMLTAQPFHYIDPQWNVAAALLAGAELVVLDGFHPSTFWSQVRSYSVTYFYCLGAMPNLLLAMPTDPLDREHQVRVVQCSAIPPARHAEIENRWGVGWYEAFGMTETGADLRVGAAEHDELVGTGCLGRPAAHREVLIVDGEMLLRGPGMFDGYLGHPSPLRDGWFPTGDLARVDDQGRVYLRGRIKDMIRRGGENVAAQEVEQVLMSHPLVKLAAVVGVPDELRGEEVKAFVVLTTEGPAGTEAERPEAEQAAREPAGREPAVQELADWCSERLASFKVPRYWEFRAELPLTPSERVAKHLLDRSTP